MYALLAVLALLNQPELPPAQEMVVRVIERTLADRAEFELRDLAFTKTRVTYNTKKKLIPQRMESGRFEPKRWRMWYSGGDSVQQLIAKRGVAVTDAKEESPGHDWFLNLPNLFDFSWAGLPIQEIDGQLVYVIRFEPKKKLPEVETREEKGLVRMAGTLYVDVEQLYVVRLDCVLPKTYRHGWFGAFKANTVTGSFSQRMEDDLVVFDSMVFRVNYSTFGYEWHLILVMSYDDYGPRDNQEPPDR